MYDEIKIKIFYVHPTNYGNMMMVSSFIDNFSQIMRSKGFNNISYYLDVLDNKELQIVKGTISSEINVYQECIYNKKRRGILGKIEKLVNIPREIKYNIKTYDLCVVLGGDCISQYYSKQVFISDLIKFKHISKKSSLILLGQTMGPFNGYAKTLVNKCLNKCIIYLRDKDCYEYMNSNFKSLDIRESRDLAFLDIPLQNDNVKKIIDRYVGSQEYVTIVPSGAIRQYTSNIVNYTKEYVKIIKYIIDSQNTDVLLLAHVIHVSDSNDLVAIREIVKQLDNTYMKRIHIVDYIIPSYEARILLGCGKYTITGRMHAAVSSLNKGVLPICLSYSVKFKGVIGDEFNLNKYIIQCRGDQFWESDYVSTSVISLIGEIEKEKKTFQTTLPVMLDMTKKKSMQQLIDTAHICEEILNGKYNK